ncbi:MAG: hypothetical protein GY737_09915 [Desulfobacteraceae bacterium]|nr:hypothetical protein [Desulfobacteraceae bacterium]
MKISLVKNGNSEQFPAISANGDAWYRAPDTVGTDIVDILAYEKNNPGKLAQTLSDPVDMDKAYRMLPFQPKAYRDFMLYEKHCIDASRGFVKKYLPRLMLVIGAYETVTGGHALFPGGSHCLCVLGRAAPSG